MSGILERAAAWNTQRVTPEEWFATHPTKPCSSRCIRGQHETHNAEGKLTALHGCTTCRGLGKEFLTLAEMAAEYDATRARVCARDGLTPVQFDWLVIFTTERWRPDSEDMQRRRYAAAKAIEDKR